jgi:small subunit ribosomal protein S21e
MWADLHSSCEQKEMCQPELIVVFVFCSSSTNRLITSKDHASVQLNVGHLDANGIYTGQFTTFALCGNVRAQLMGNINLLLQGDADSALDRLWAKKKAELGQ